MKLIQKIILSIACIILPAKTFTEPDVVAPETKVQSIQPTDLSTIKAKTSYEQTLADILAQPDKTTDDAAKKESLFGDDDNETAEIILPVKKAVAPAESIIITQQPATPKPIAQQPSAKPTPAVNPNRTEIKTTIDPTNILISTITKVKYENNLIKQETITKQNRETNQSTTQIIDYTNGKISKSTVQIEDPIHVMTSHEHEAAAPQRMQTGITTKIETIYNDDDSVTTIQEDYDNSGTVITTTILIKNSDGTSQKIIQNQGKPTVTHYFDKDGKETAAPAPKKANQEEQSDYEKKEKVDSFDYLDDLLSSVNNLEDKQQAQITKISQDAKIATDKAKTVSDRLAVVQKAISDCTAQFFTKFKPLERNEYQRLFDGVKKEQPIAGSSVEKFITWISSILTTMKLYFRPAPKELSLHDQQEAEQAKNNEKEDDEGDARSL